MRHSKASSRRKHRGFDLGLRYIPARKQLVVHFPVTPRTIILNGKVYLTSKEAAMRGSPWPVTLYPTTDFQEVDSLRAQMPVGKAIERVALERKYDVENFGRAYRRFRKKILDGTSPV
jgi:hypothetical protein